MDKKKLKSYSQIKNILEKHFKNAKKNKNVFIPNVNFFFKENHICTICAKYKYKLN